MSMYETMDLGATYCPEHAVERLIAAGEASPAARDMDMRDLMAQIDDDSILRHEPNSGHCADCVNARVTGNARVYGGAWVYDKAWVYGDARVTGKAQVYEKARVYGNAMVSGDAQVYGNALVSGDARVSCGALIYDNAKVSGNALVSGDARVTGNAQVYGNATVGGDAGVSGGALVYGNARITGQVQVYGNAMVSGDAGVYGNAKVYGDSWVSGNAVIQGNGDTASTRHYLTVGPIGSESRTVTIHRHYDGPESTKWGHLITAGCWSGSLDELDTRIHSSSDHGWDEDADRWVADYEAFIAMARIRVAEWEAEPLTSDDHARWDHV